MNSLSMGLRSVAMHERNHNNQPELAGIIESAANAIDRLRAAYLAHIQMENACRRTGQPCREPMKCGCDLELVALLANAPGVDEQAPAPKER